MAAAYVGRPSVRDRRVAVACSQCGAELKRPEWWMAQNSAGLQFCDSGCFGAWKSVNWTAEANPSWAGGSDRYYGSNWHRQSREARKRDGHRCQSESDHSRALDVHHIRPLRLFDIADYERANKLANLVTLCPACHGRAERFSRDGSVSSWPALLAVMWS